MLEFCLNKNHLEWKNPQDGSWSNSDSYIRPFFHRMINIHYVREIGRQNRWMVVARESCRSTSSINSVTIKECSENEFDRQCNLLLENDLDWVAILVTPSYNTQVSLMSGKFGTLPCYLLCKNQTLYGSYIPASLFPLIDKDNPLDFQRTSLFVANGAMPYGADLIFKKVKLLTAGSKIIWRCNTVKNSELEIYYPPKSDPVYPKKIKSNVDITIAFEHIVRNAINRRLGRKLDGVIAELSGGLDSSIVAGVTNRMTRGRLSTAGLLLPPSSLHQAHRRDILITTFNLNDIPISAEDYPPLSVNSPGFDKNRAAWEELYMEAFNALFKRARETDHDILLTGLGGDELFLLNLHELDVEHRMSLIEESRKELFDFPCYLTNKAQEAIKEVIPKIDYYPLKTPNSTLESLMNGAPMIAKAGLWPIHPFADPETVEFCQQLPLDMRRDRNLQRKLLSSWGLPESVWNPKYKEEFSSFMSASIKANALGIQQLFQDSRLHQMGILNQNMLIDEFQKYLNKNQTSNIADTEYRFYLVVATEIMLRSICCSQQ